MPDDETAKKLGEIIDILRGGSDPPPRYRELDRLRTLSFEAGNDLLLAWNKRLARATTGTYNPYAMWRDATEMVLESWNAAAHVMSGIAGPDVESSPDLFWNIKAGETPPSRPVRLNRRYEKVRATPLEVVGVAKGTAAGSIPATAVGTKLDEDGRHLTVSWTAAPGLFKAGTVCRGFILDDTTGEVSAPAATITVVVE